MNWPTSWGPKVRYVTCYRDRPTFQRRKGSPRVVMDTNPGEDRAGFQREYLNLMASQANGTLQGRAKGGPDKTHHRDKGTETVGHLATLWRGSPQFARLKTETARGYARFLDRALLTVIPQQSNAPFAEMKVAGMLQAHAEQLRQALPKPRRQRIKTDASFRDFHMIILRNMFGWALTKGSVPWVNRNPFARLEPLHKGTELAYSWRRPDWEKFGAHFPLGTQQHLAMVVLRYLGTRVSDLAHLGANNGELSRLVDDHRKGNKTRKRIDWLEYKNSTSEARRILKRRSLKVHPDLWAALQATPGALDRPTFLVSRLGTPYKHGTIGDMFNRWCADADLPLLGRAHGVRRGGAKWLWENGATMHQIKAWGGWRELANVQRYTKDADDARMGDDAVDVL